MFNSWCIYKHTLALRCTKSIFSRHPHCGCAYIETVNHESHFYRWLCTHIQYIHSRTRTRWTLHAHSQSDRTLYGIHFNNAMTQKKTNVNIYDIPHSHTPLYSTRSTPPQYMLSWASSRIWTSRVWRHRATIPFNDIYIYVNIALLKCISGIIY